jgi:hypothetical protein
MSNPASPDILAFARDLLVELSTGTALEDAVIRADRLEAGDEPPAVLLGEAGSIRSKTLPAFLPARISVKTFGSDEEEASSLWRAVSDLLHRAGPLVRDGVAMWAAFDETGPQPTTDPDTRWPMVFGVFNLHVADRAIS